jgi:hypothetical protein
MTTPKEFIESYLQERSAAAMESRPFLKAVYAKYFGEPLSQHAEYFMPSDTVREVVVDVKQPDGVATVIVSTGLRHSDYRTRYRLVVSGESWKIISIAPECFMCRGTGKSNGAQCEHCDGEGWREPKRGEA